MDQSLGKRASHIFYQCVTVVIFKELVKQHSPTDTLHCGSDLEVPALNYQEKSALRYAAGYVIHAIKKRPFQQELKPCLVELCEEDDDEVDPLADWMTQISRGGLYLVNNRTYIVRGFLRNGDEDWSSPHSNVGTYYLSRVQIYRDRIHLFR